MSERVFALIDANSFYCSCERVFRPDLKHRPIVVLSNNDGCVISRTAEAKKLGIKMGAPYFQIRDGLRRWGVEVFSSNYALYGDMSERVMTTIESMVPAVEVYSIDECFAELTGYAHSLDALAHDIRARVMQWTGIPVGVGIAPTKTLAKLANYAAKRWQHKTGGVVDLCDPIKQTKLLKAVGVEEVWGVGRRLSAHLNALGIVTAWDLACYDARSLRTMFNVVLEKTAHELQGTSCLSLTEAYPPRQMICSSRMFGERQHDFNALAEAIASYIQRAAEKLRKQGSLCKVLRVAIRTGMFNADQSRYSNSMVCDLPYPTDDVRVLTRYALAGLERIFQKGYAYSKAEVLLMDLCQRGEYTDDLFTPSQGAGADRLMKVMDVINHRYGRGMLRTARVTEAPFWAMRQDLMSPRYTTRIGHVWSVGNDKAIKNADS